MDLTNMVLEAMDAEKNGDINKAIQLYEQVISKRFDGNRPYDRLAVIYHKQKKYDDERRVLTLAIDVFTRDVNPSRADRLPKLQKFHDKLAKIKE